MVATQHLIMQEVFRLRARRRIATERSFRILNQLPDGSAHGADDGMSATPSQINQRADNSLAERLVEKADRATAAGDGIPVNPRS